MKDEIRKPRVQEIPYGNSEYQKHETIGYNKGLKVMKGYYEALISKNYIPKERVLTREDIEKIITTEINKFYVKPSGTVLPITNIAQAIYNYLKEKE